MQERCRNRASRGNEQRLTESTEEVFGLRSEGIRESVEQSDNDVNTQRQSILLSMRLKGILWQEEDRVTRSLFLSQHSSPLICPQLPARDYPRHYGRKTPMPRKLEIAIIIFVS